MRSKFIIKLLAFSIAILTLLSFITVNASSKLSEYDFSRWQEIATKKVDFENYADGEALTNSNKPADWIFRQASKGPSVIKEENDNKYLIASGYLHMHQEWGTENLYTFSVDIQSPDDRNVVMFARAGKERFPMQPPTLSTFYENDHGNVNGGVGGLGGSGFYIRPNGTKIQLFIKLYDTDQIYNINNAFFEFDAGTDFATGLRKVTMVDDGTSVSIYVEDNFIANLAFSNVTNYPIGNEDYYSHVVITGADGEEVGTVDNAIISTKSIVAVALRNTTAHIDNIIFSEYEEITEPDTEEETEEPPITSPETEEPITNPETNDTGFILILTLTAALLLVIKKRVYA